MAEDTFMANLQAEGESIDKLEFSSDKGKPDETEEVETPPESERQEKEETPAESPTENKPDDKTDSPPEEEKAKEGEEPKGDEPSEGETPLEESAEPVVTQAFHDHPRWIANQQELKELREQNQELLDWKEQQDKLQKETSETKISDEPPAEFKDLFGDDREAWRKFQTLTGSDKIVDSVMEKLKPTLEITEKIKQQNEFEAWATKEWQAVKSDPNVQADLKKLGRTLDQESQNEIQEVLMERRPSDEEGRYSLRGAFELWRDLPQYQNQKSSTQPKQSTTEKKQVADKTVKKTVEAGSGRDYMTSADFVGKTMADL